MKEIIYNITQQTEGRKVAITGVSEPVNKNNVLGIINKTQSKVLYTPLQYANLISSEWYSLDGGTLTLTLADNVQIINAGDQLFVKLYLDKDIDFTLLAKENTLTQGVNTISQKIDDIHIPELDKSDLAKEATLSSGISTLSNKIDNIDLTSVENKVDEGVETLSNKIDNIDTSHLAKESSLNEAKAEIVEAVNNAKPEIDLSGVAQETTLLEVKNAVENIDLTSIESKVETESQAIQSAIQNIDLSSVENKVDEVKQAVENIDLTPIDNKVQEGVNTLSSKIDNIDLSAVENKVQEESAAIQAKIGNIKFPELDTTELAKEATLNAVSSKLDNLNIEVDLSSVSKQGENQEATNTAIYDTLNYIKDDVIDIVQSQLTEVDNLLDF